MEPLVDVCAIRYRICHFFLTVFGQGPKPSPNGAFPLDEVNLDSVMNEALEGFLETAPLLHRFSGTRVVRLSKDLVLKGGRGQQ